MKPGDHEMPSECFIFNEWLLHDLRGDNGREAQVESYQFLERLKEKCDHIAVLNGSPWITKAYQLMKLEDSLVRKLSKFFHVGIMQDSRKCRLLDWNDIKVIPEDLRAIVPKDDLYLIECYYSANANALVTTDQKLCDALSNAKNININVKTRDDFLKQYLISSQ